MFRKKIILISLIAILLPIFILSLNLFGYLPCSNFIEQFSQRNNWDNESQRLMTNDDFQQSVEMEEIFAKRKERVEKYCDSLRVVKMDNGHAQSNIFIDDTLNFIYCW